MHAPAEKAMERPVEVAVPEKKVVAPIGVVDVQTKKMRFFAKLRPVVQAENKRILALRSKVLELSQQTSVYSPDQLEMLHSLAVKYRVPLSGKPNASFWSRLLKRVDAVPVPLALAQAANESAWGTSRFARQGNNFFGQWCYSEGCGMVPSRRNEGAAHEVKVFASAAASVRSYIHNLNTGRAYSRLRSIRLHLRRSGQKLDAMQLANGLISYSELGAVYVKSIRKMIRRNRPLMLPKG